MKQKKSIWFTNEGVLLLFGKLCCTGSNTISTFASGWNKEKQTPENRVDSRKLQFLAAASPQMPKLFVSEEISREAALAPHRGPLPLLARLWTRAWSVLRALPISAPTTAGAPGCWESHKVTVPATVTVARAGEVTRVVVWNQQTCGNSPVSTWSPHVLRDGQEARLWLLLVAPPSFSVGNARFLSWALAWALPFPRAARGEVPTTAGELSSCQGAAPPPGLHWHRLPLNGQLRSTPLGFKTYNILYCLLDNQSEE